MNRQRVRQNDFLLLSISFFVVVAAWIGFSVYHAYATTTITEDLQMQIIPIDGKFDTQTIDNLKNREKVAPIYEGVAEVTPTPTGSPLVAPTPVVEEIITPSAAPVPSVTTTQTSLTPTTSVTTTVAPTISP